MQSKTAAYILTTIENLEKEVAFLKALIQQAISEDANEEHIIVDAEFTDDDTIIVEGSCEPDSKPSPKPLSLKEQRKEARRRAQVWGQEYRLTRKPPS
jgi:hypothetical protein